jgi:hypothetical protein
MIQRNRMTNLLAAMLIVSVQALALPVSAGAAPASLTGALVHAADQTPLVGAKLHVGNPETGAIVTAAPTDAKGAFRVTGLEAATYELAVETAGGLYVVATPVRLAPGQARTLSVAIAATAAAADDDDDDKPGAANAPAKTSLWENPLTAALIVLGGAIVVGYVVDEATDDDDESDASPS